MSRSERLALIDWETRELPIKTQAELLGLNRTHLYYKPRGPSEEELALKREIDEIYTEFPFYGSRRITAVLRSRGWHVNRKAVQRHMREMGLEAIYPKANLSRRNQEHRVYPYCVEFGSTRPIRSGGRISHTYGCVPAGCTWWSCWTGTPGTW